MFRTIAIASIAGMLAAPAIAQEAPDFTGTNEPWADELAGVNERMGDYDRRFADYDRRFADYDRRMADYDARMQQVERRYEELRDGLEEAGMSLSATTEAMTDEERDLVRPGTVE